MNTDVGIEADSGLAHPALGTPTYANNVTKNANGLYRDEIDAFGDTGYQGIENRKAKSPGVLR